MQLNYRRTMRVSLINNFSKVFLGWNNIFLFTYVASSARRSTTRLVHNFARLGLLRATYYAPKKHHENTQTTCWDTCTHADPQRHTTSRFRAISSFIRQMETVIIIHSADGESCHHSFMIGVRTGTYTDTLSTSYTIYFIHLFQNRNIYYRQ